MSCQHNGQFMEEKLYILKELMPFMTFNHGQVFLTSIERGLALPDEHNIFMLTPNPIKLAVLIMDYCEHMKRSFGHSHGRIDNLMAKLTAMVTGLTKQTTNE